MGASDAPMLTPQRALAPQAQPEGGQPHATAQQPHGPSLRSAPRRAGARSARARKGPSAAMARVAVRFRVPFRMRRGAQRPADQGSRLSERSEFERDPAGREHRRLPAAKRRDAACRVAFSLVTFFWRSKRKLLRRRAHTPAFCPLHKAQHSGNYKNNSYQRLIHKRYRPICLKNSNRNHPPLIRRKLRHPRSRSYTGAKSAAVMSNSCSKLSITK